MSLDRKEGYASVRKQHWKLLALFITALKVDQKAKLDTINCEASYCVTIPF